MTSCLTPESESLVGPAQLAERFGQRFRPRLRTDDLEGLRESIRRILDSMPAANAQRHYIEALDMRVDEWLDSEDSDFKRPRVSLADLDVMLRVCAHPLGNIDIFTTLQISPELSRAQLIDAVSDVIRGVELFRQTIGRWQR